MVNASTFTVRVDVAELPVGGVTGLAEKEPVTPKGFPERDRATAEANPFNDATVTVELPEPPCCTLRVFGAIETEKSGA